MEAREEDIGGLLHKITPPKLDDAGLEDCALPLHSIHDAFLKAASAVGSRVSDPPPDALVGVTVDGNGIPSFGPCSGQKGGPLVGGGGLGSEDLVVGGGKEKEKEKDDDDILVIGGGGGSGSGSGGCVDGVKDLDINHGGNDDDDNDNDNDKEKKPILVEGFLFTP